MNSVHSRKEYSLSGQTEIHWTSLQSLSGWADLTPCCCQKKIVLPFLWAFPQNFAPSSSSALALACPTLWEAYSVPCISRKLFLFLAEVVFWWVTGLSHLTEASENKQRTSPLCRSRDGRKKERGLGQKCNSEVLQVGSVAGGSCY